MTWNRLEIEKLSSPSWSNEMNQNTKGSLAEVKIYLEFDVVDAQSYDK